MRKRIFTCALILGLTVLGISGCGKKETAESIIEKCKANVTEYSSMEGSLLMEMDAVMASQGISLDMAVSMDMDLKIQRTESQELNYSNGTVALEMLGQTMEENMESYTVVEGNTVKNYNYSYEEWEYTEASLEDIGSMTESFDAIYGEGTGWVLSEEKVEKNGKECYELKGIVAGEDMSSLLEMGNQLALDETADMTKLELPVTLYVDADEFYPVSIFMDAADSLSSMFVGTEAEGTEFAKFTISFEDLEYNGDVNIQIPEEALAAEENSFEWDETDAWEEEMTGSGDEEEFLYEADEEELRQVTADGEYTLGCEDTEDKIFLDWPDECECYFIGDFGMLSLSHDSYYVTYEIYPKSIYEETDINAQLDEWVNWCKEDKEFYQNLVVSEPVTMTTAEGYDFQLVYMDYMGMGSDHAVDCMGYVEYEDSFLLITANFYNDISAEEKMEEIIAPIKLVK